MHEIPSTLRHIHLIAICGTGTGSLAGLLKEAGYEVTGSDQNTYPPMSTQLENLGIKLFQGYRAENLRNLPDLVIIGNAVSKDNPEVQEVMRAGLPYCSMPEALSHFFITGKKSVVVAGTHGKTTTSALLAHLLSELGADPSYLVGGVIQNSDSTCHIGRGKYFVVEGDEYDTAFFDKGPKFLHYRPTYAIVTSLEFDHADIFRDLDHMVSAFEAFLEKVNPAGLVMACAYYERLLSILGKSRAPVETYGFQSADWILQNLSFGPDSTEFEIWHRSKKEGRLKSPLPGKHNALNVLSAYALLRNLGYADAAIQKALLTFKGVRRRQEIRGTANGITVMDDFAHHPTAVRETIDAVKKSFPGHALWAVFEPRSASSKRNIFQEDYARAFDKADHVILADVFMPEKVKDGKILDVEKLAGDISTRGVSARHISGVDAIVQNLVSSAIPPSVILIMSNGGFGGIHQKILDALNIITPPDPLLS